MTGLLESRLDADPDSVVYACGPTPMMERCATISAERGVTCMVSLENHMACGFGVCLGGDPQPLPASQVNNPMSIFDFLVH